VACFLILKNKGDIMKVKVKNNKSKKVILSAKELLTASVEELVAEKLGDSKDFYVEDVNFNGSKCEVMVNSGEPQIVDIDENLLMDKNIKQIVKDKLGLKTIKNIEIEIISVGK
jgi:hypothetical protein